MTLSETFTDSVEARKPETTPQRKRVDQSCLQDLIAVLLASPAGLRRWSVMRAMRVRAEKAHREVSPKFEDDVERVFRRFCEGDSSRAGMNEPASEIFHRPKEKTGEVWAVYPEKAQAWLEDGSRSA